MQRGIVSAVDGRRARVMRPDNYVTGWLYLANSIAEVQVNDIVFYEVFGNDGLILYAIGRDTIVADLLGNYEPEDFIRGSGEFIGGNVPVIDDERTLKDSGLAAESLIKADGDFINGNIPVIDDERTLKDSGLAANDIVKASGTLNSGNLPIINSNREIVDSNHKIGTWTATMPVVPILRKDGVIEVGRILDFHYDSDQSNDFDLRLGISSACDLYITKGGGVYSNIWHEGNFPIEAGGWDISVFTESGSLVAYEVIRAYFYRVGRLIYVEVSIKTTTLGTATGWLGFSLPAPIAGGGGNRTLAGRENAVSGAMLQGRLSGSSCLIWKYNNSSPLAAGAICELSGTYITA